MKLSINHWAMLNWSYVAQIWGEPLVWLKNNSFLHYSGIKLWHPFFVIAFISSLLLVCWCLLLSLVNWKPLVCSYLKLLFLHPALPYCVTKSLGGNTPEKMTQAVWLRISRIVHPKGWVFRTMGKWSLLIRMPKPFALLDIHYLNISQLLPTMTA